MSKRKNVSIIMVTIIIYVFNQMFKNTIPVISLKWFMTCYFNDIIGSVTFIAYCNLIFAMGNKNIVKIWQIELLMLGCGIFWEYITPFFRKNTVSDIYDIGAYMFGGLIYWMIFKALAWKNHVCYDK